jgi:hypothetical protein
MAPTSATGSESEQTLIDGDRYWVADDGFRASPCGKIIAKNEEEIRRDLDLKMRPWGEKNSKDPYTWGFVLYRACFGGEFDQRFASAVKKLDSWTRYLAQQRRYAGLQPKDKDDPACDPTAPDGKTIPSMDLAKRFKLDIIEDYPDGTESVSAGFEVDDGDEDFMAVGKAFLDWVDENAVDTSNLYVRNDHCLIIDERSLVTLEALPDTVPKPGPIKLVGGGCDLYFTESPQKDAWVWILDREYYDKYAEAGKQAPHVIPLPPYSHLKERRFDPWVRIRIDKLMRVWWYRPDGYEPGSWQSCIARDRDKFDRVNWWEGAPAPTTNDSIRQGLDHERELELDGTATYVFGTFTAEQLEGLR